MPFETLKLVPSPQEKWRIISRIGKRGEMSKWSPSEFWVRAFDSRGYWHSNLYLPEERKELSKFCVSTKYCIHIWVVSSKSEIRILLEMFSVYCLLIEKFFFLTAYFSHKSSEASNDVYLPRWWNLGHMIDKVFVTCNSVFPFILIQC